jgi:hypothetical protein
MPGRIAGAAVVFEKENRIPKQWGQACNIAIVCII